MATRSMRYGSRVPKIYGLYDPRKPDDIKYVGVTIQNLTDRLSNHRRNIWETKNPTNKEKWIDRLKREGVQPEIKLLEECETVELMYEQEIVWIQNLRKQGYKLANTSKRGRGGFSYTKSDKWKQFIKEDNIRRNLDPEYHKKLSQAQVESYKNNPEQKEKQSSSQKLLWQDPEWRSKTIATMKKNRSINPTLHRNKNGNQ